LTEACSPKPITTCCSVLPPEIVMHDAYIDRCFPRTKINRKASDVVEYIELFGYFTRDRHARRRIYRRTADVQRITLHASCMTISGGRTKQLNIFCHVTGFTGDFLSWRASWKNRIYWYIAFFRPSRNRVLFLMFCLLVEGECQILVF